MNSGEYSQVTFFIQLGHRETLRLACQQGEISGMYITERGCV